MSLAAVKLDEYEDFPRPAAGGERREGPLRCVLLDDSRFDRRHLRNVAANSRYKIEFVETGTIAETRAVLKSRKADFLVLDNLLPDGTGLDLARQLADDAKTSGTPVIMTTGASSEKVAIQALRAGAADYLAKEELSTEVFDQAVENALKRSSARTEDQSQTIAQLESENSALRRIALRNMRLLKAQVMPLMSFAWRMLRGDKIAEGDKPRISKGLAKVTRGATGLIDDTVITSATYSHDNKAEPVDLSELVQQVVQEDLGELKDSRAHIRVGPLPTLTARRAQMSMLFEELLLTAIRSGRLGRVPEVEIGASKDPEGNPIIWLTERGVQLSARKQRMAHRISELDASPEDSAKDENSWSLCQRLVEKNEGQFKIAENTDQGCKLMMRFPKSAVVEPSSVVPLAYED